MWNSANIKPAFTFGLSPIILLKVVVSPLPVTDVLGGIREKMRVPGLMAVSVKTGTLISPSKIQIATLCAGCSRTSCALEITRDESSFMITSPEELCLQGSVSGYSYIFFLCSSSNPWDFCFIHEQKQMIFIVHAAMSGTGNIYSARCFLLYFIEHPWRSVGTAMDLLLLSPERGMVLQTLTFLLKETPASPVVLGTHFLARGSDNSLFLMPTQICPFPLFPAVQGQVWR